MGKGLRVSAAQHNIIRVKERERSGGRIQILIITGKNT
jgi:hypothetical protein